MPHFTARDILKLPDERRRRVGRKRGSYKIVSRTSFTREELVDYLRKNDFKSTRSFIGGRQPGDPTVYDYQQEFASWEEAKDAIFGRDISIDFDPEYVVKAIIEFDLWTARRYAEARNLRPDILPSMYKVKKQWGSFRQLKAVAERLSISKVFDAYVIEARKLGRVPTSQECEQKGIGLDAALALFKGKRKMDELVILMLEESNEETG